MATYMLIRPSYSDNKARTGPQKQQERQHLQVLASHHTAVTRGMAQLSILAASTPRRLDGGLRNPKEALICPLVVVCANDIGALNRPAWERTTHC